MRNGFGCNIIVKPKTNDLIDWFHLVIPLVNILGILALLPLNELILKPSKQLDIIYKCLIINIHIDLKM